MWCLPPPPVVCAVWSVHGVVFNPPPVVVTCTYYVCRYVVEVTEPDVLVAMRNAEAAEARVSKVVLFSMVEYEVQMKERERAGAYIPLFLHCPPNTLPLFYILFSPAPYTLPLPHQVVLGVVDLDESVDFYSQRLGMTELRRRCVCIDYSSHAIAAYSCPLFSRSGTDLTHHFTLPHHRSNINSLPKDSSIVAHVSVSTSEGFATPLLELHYQYATEKIDVGTGLVGLGISTTADLSRCDPRLELHTYVPSSHANLSSTRSTACGILMVISWRPSRPSPPRTVLVLNTTRVILIK